MTRMWIVIGDTTSGGGRVVTGSSQTVIDGSPVARLGDKATCASHKGTFPIVDGDPTTIIDGQPVALHGSKLACGCSVLAVNQHRVFIDQGGGDHSTGTLHQPRRTDETGDPAKNQFDERFRLVHPSTDLPIALMPYRITGASGCIHEGITDEDGYTQRIETPASEALSITVFEISRPRSENLDVNA